ncbi:MAG: S8 family serine peptidase, partial [Verrucomicrobiota bacterium]
MLISLMLFAASAWMWQLGGRVADERRQRAAGLRISRERTQGTQSPAAPGTTNSAGAIPVSAKKPTSYVLSNTPQTLAQLARNQRGILLRNALIDTSRGTKLEIPQHLRAQGAPGSYIVQSARGVDAGFYAELGKDGAEVVSYIPNNAVLARASAEAGKTLAADPVFAAVLPYEPYYKLDGTLLPEAVEQTPMTNTMLRVTVFNGQSEAAAQSLAALGASVTGRDQSPFGTTLIANVPPDKLAAVAQMPQAQEIESYSPRRMMNDLTRARLGVAATPTNSSNYLNLTGSNIWVVVNDTGVDSTHPDFTGRLTYDSNLYASAALQVDTNGHGTHVAGIIGGSGAGTVTGTNIPGSGKPVANQFRGMAPGAKLFVQGADTLSGAYISDFYLQTNASYSLMTNTAGATTGVTNGFVNNCSWGYEGGGYDETAASYDAAVRNAQPNYPGEHAMTYVFAAGDGFGGGITSPGTGKNVITVGATDSPRDITNQITLPGETNVEYWYGETATNNAVADLSSAGNVDFGTEGPFGRFKPDVVAPGIFIISARSAGFVDPALAQAKYYWAWEGAVWPGGTNWVGTITLPTNIVTSNVLIQVTANDQSPVPFPTDFQVYFDTNTPPSNAPPAFGPATLLTMTNQAGLAVGPAPPATNCYIGLCLPATNLDQPTAFNLNLWVIANESQFGPSYATNSYFGVLSNLDNALLPNYRYESGTSMSAAAVSGMLADMQEFLSSKLNTNPSPALLKALLINGARPLNNDSDLSPDQLQNFEGWGLPNLSNSVPASLTSTNGSSMAFFDQSPTNALQTGEWHNYTVTVTGGTNYPLRMTLVWTDPPGNPAAGIALVNNLDLMVADNSGTNLYMGNDFPIGGGPTGCFTQPSPTNSPDPSDIVNNVQCVNLYASAKPPVTLSTNFTVSVRGTRVNVNAVSGQTNAILQDYALVISSDAPTNSGLRVTDLGTTNGPPTNTAGTILASVLNPTNVNTIPTRDVTVISNTPVLIHQRVGGNEPNLWGTNTVSNLLGTANVGTNGNPLQWHFFVLTNTATTNTALYGTNAANFTNAVFATFLPPSLTFPSFSPANMSPPAINNADIDLYVSTDSALTNLDEAAVSNSLQSLGRGGNNYVIFTNASSNQVYYAGVKSETQQGADFGFFAEITTNLNSVNPDGSVTGYGQGLPAPIPDDTPGDQGAFVFAFVGSANATTARKVAVLVGLEHSNPADLAGTISMGQTQSTINYYTASDEAGFTNWYDDLPDGSITNPVPTDAPGDLKSFVGQPMSGMYILNEKDNALLQTGMVTTLQVRVWPQPPNPLGFFIPYIAPNGWYYGFVDVPNDTTNLLIQVAFNNGGPLGIYLDNADDVSTNDYGVTPIFPMGGQLDDPNTNMDIPPTPVNVTNMPAMTGGRWYYGIYNEGATQVTNVEVVITIKESLTPNLTLTETDNTATNLQTGAHTQSQICVSNTGPLVSLQVGVRLTDTNLDDLVLHLISPQGTSVLLFEDRGGTNATDLGLSVTNATNVTYAYTTFTENTNLASQLIKFAAPPYAQPTTNVDILDTDFDTVAAGDYGLSNALLPILSASVEQWTVLTNDVAVVTGSGLYQGYGGTNYLAL